MAIIRGGSPFGEIRGKIGASVFSRNAAGQIVRAYAIPVNHNSLAQRLSRNTLSSASAMWCTIGNDEKAAWNSFAKDPVRYAPLYKMNAGGINGQNAFVALYSEVQKNNSLGLGTILTPTGLTPQNYTFNALPPMFPNDGTVEGSPVLSASASTTVDTNAELVKVNVTLNLDPGLTQGKQIAPGDKLKNAHGDPIGFGVYISTPKKNEPNYVRRMEKKIGTSGIPKNEGTTPVSLGTTFMFEVSRPITDFWKFPQEGEVILVTIVSITETGNPRKVFDTIDTVNYV